MRDVFPMPHTPKKSYKCMTYTDHALSRREPNSYQHKTDTSWTRQISSSTPYVRDNQPTWTQSTSLPRRRASLRSDAVSRRYYTSPTTHADDYAQASSEPQVASANASSFCSPSTHTSPSQPSAPVPSPPAKGTAMPSNGNKPCPCPKTSAT